MCNSIDATQFAEPWLILNNCIMILIKNGVWAKTAKKKTNNNTESYIVRAAVNYILGESANLNAILQTTRTFDKQTNGVHKLSSSNNGRLESEISTD